MPCCARCRRGRRCRRNEPKPFDAFRHRGSQRATDGYIARDRYGSATPADLGLPRQPRVGFRVLVWLSRPIVVPRSGVRLGRGTVQRAENDLAIPIACDPALRLGRSGFLAVSGRRFTQAIPGDWRVGRRRPTAGAGGTAAAEGGAGDEESQKFHMHCCPAWCRSRISDKVRSLNLEALTLMRRKRAGRPAVQRFTRLTAAPFSPTTFTSSFPHLKSRANSSAAWRATSLALRLAWPSI
jgi:hypothetical protein